MVVERIINTVDLSYRRFNIKVKKPNIFVNVQVFYKVLNVYFTVIV